MYIGKAAFFTKAGIRTDDLKGINKDLQPAYMLNQTVNNLKTSAEDALILTAGAAGTAGATLIAKNHGNIKGFVQNLVSKFKLQNLKTTFSQDTIKEAGNKIKTAFSAEKLKLAGEKLKGVNLGKIEKFATKSFDKIKTNINSKFTKIDNNSFKNVMSKIKNLPGPAKAVMAAGAALTALFVINNKTKGAYKAGQINQKYQDMSKELDKYDKK